MALLEEVKLVNRKPELPAVPWLISNVFAGEEVPIPTFVPSSKIELSVSVLAAENLGIKLVVPLPPILSLKVVQSVALNAPLLAAEAVGTFNVTTGVVVAVATVEVISVPEVPIVKALTSVTVPLLGVGIFKVEPTNEAAPVPEVVNVIASCLPAVAVVTKAVVAI